MDIKNNYNESSKLFFILISILLITVPSVFGIDKTIKNIGADKLHIAGITGKGKTVCVIDSGFDYTHPNLGGCAESDFISGNCNRFIGGYDFGENDSNPIEKSDFTNNEAKHGTQVLGIIASNNSQYKGVAPGANVIMIKFPRDYISVSRAEKFANIKSGMQWCIDNSTKFNISVISMSLGYVDNNNGYDESSCPDDYGLQSKIQEAAAKDIVVAIASGNSFLTNGIATPACLKNATSVGSSTVWDWISLHTNRGTALDLLAPGSFITTTKVGGGFTGLFEELVSGGTSFATPHVAGAILLIKEFDPAMRNRDIEKLLVDTGKKIEAILGSDEYPRIDLLSALNVLDWPTENHDFRRTGFTLLKGDLTSVSKVKNQINLALDSEDVTEQVVKPTVADLDGNGYMDSVVLMHKTSFNTYTKMFGVENQKQDLRKWNQQVKLKPVQKWPEERILGGAIYFPASLANIDSDNKKEIITGTRNGTVYVYDINADGTITQKWVYYLEERIAPGTSTPKVNFNGGSAVADIDLDGDMEVVIADVVGTDIDWPGKVYVLNGNTGVNETSYNIGNGGAYGSVSIANVDSDDYPEIIVPTQYGIKVFDYDSSTEKLTQKCSNSHAYIWGSGVVADVDKDNDYEIVYVTSDFGCETGQTCENKLHVIDPLTCNDAANFPISFTDKPRTTPSVANLDSDSNLEIIISLEQTIPNGLGSIKSIDAVTGTTQWTYNDGENLHPGFVSPNIADIDNDGYYNVILGENNGNTIYILKEDGSLLYKYTVSGFMDNGLAIADVDDDESAEIVFKRSGSPTLFTSASNENFPPEINTISNITAIAGQLIDINTSGEVSAIDLENGDLTFFYSSPFNSSGLWQTTINDTGNYSILVEASDGNLSTYKFVDVIVFNETTKVVDTFSDESSKKFLNFTQSGNLSVTVRIPKNATVIYSKITLQGQEP